MTVSSALGDRFHQTRISVAIRKIPGIRTLARRRWLSQQSQQSQRFWAALSNVPDPQADGQAAWLKYQALRKLKKVKRFAADGAALVREMSSYCTTSKFMFLGYEDVYSQVCRHLRDWNARVLEVGIGVNDRNAPSGMSASHGLGSSLVGWSRYLHDSEVHAADIDQRVLIDTPAYRTHYFDQHDSKSLQELGNAIDGPLDLVIDDGLHTAEANALTVQALLPRLSRRGVTVVEDILPEFNGPGRMRNAR